MCPRSVNLLNKTMNRALVQFSYQIRPWKVVSLNSLVFGKTEPEWFPIGNSARPPPLKRYFSPTSFYLLAESLTCSWNFFISLALFFNITIEILSNRKLCQFKWSSRIKTINNFKRAMTSSLASESIISKLNLGQKKISLSNVLPHKFSQEILRLPVKILSV